jgi:hypothetical protein
MKARPGSSVLLASFHLDILGKLDTIGTDPTLEAGTHLVFLPPELGVSA